MLLGCFGGLVTGALIPFFQYLFGKMLDSLNTGDKIVESVTHVAIQFAYLAVVAFFMAALQVTAWGLNGERQVARIRNLYVKALLRQDISYYDMQTRGQTATIVSELTASAADGMGRKNGDIIEYLAQFVGGFIIAFMQSWRLTLVLMASIPAIILATAIMATLAGRAQKKGAMAYAAAGSKAYETLASIRTVQALRLQDKCKASYDRLLGEAEKMGYSKARDNATGVALMGLVVYSTFGLGFFYGARLVAANVGCDPNVPSCVSGGKVMSTFFCVIMGAMGLGSAFPCFSSVVQGKTAAETIFHVIDRVPAIDSYSTAGRVLGAKAGEEVKGEIELRDVTFAYPTRPEKQVCKNYSLKIEAGKTYALVGPSGEGKSTIMSLVSKALR
jgi:ATP-binding cassette subfamily B (MDR/TAP) protein 1